MSILSIVYVENSKAVHIFSATLIDYRNALAALTALVKSEFINIYENTKRNITIKSDMYRRIRITFIIVSFLESIDSYDPVIPPFLLDTPLPILKLACLLTL